MTVRLGEVVSYLDTTLEISRFRDYGPNGLQVEGAQSVARIVTGVSANMALFERAGDADLIVVHHGLIWGGGLSRVTGTAAERLRTLLGSGTSLAAYHLPLDFHPTLGNNAGLADAISLPAERIGFGDVRGHALGLAATLAVPRPRDNIINAISTGVCGGSEPRFVFPFGAESVKKVGLCTGAASDLMEEAAECGCDVFITGELAERAGELARELGITLVAAGHVATEVFGPMRLAAALSSKFPDAQVEFVDVPSPL